MREVISMAEKEKSYMPQSTAGLIRYFEDEGKVKLKPEHIVWVSVAFAALVIVLKVMA
jgi:preprotein translocase subunit Sec61beta